MREEETDHIHGQTGEPFFIGGNQSKVVPFRAVQGRALPAGPSGAGQPARPPAAPAARAVPGHATSAARPRCRAPRAARRSRPARPPVRADCPGSSCPYGDRALAPVPPLPPGARPPRRLPEGGPVAWVADPRPAPAAPAAPDAPLPAALEGGFWGEPPSPLFPLLRRPPARRRGGGSAPPGPALPPESNIPPRPLRSPPRLPFGCVGRAGRGHRGALAR
eukprot:tig00020561_g11105.t1